MHKQGDFREPALRQLSGEEIERGWEQYPLYTAPPQREWVGLTDEESHEYDYLGPDFATVIQEVEAKLKEKNT